MMGPTHFGPVETLIVPTSVVTNFLAVTSCSSPPIFRSNGITGVLMSSWLASSVTSPSRRGPAQRNTAYSPASGMPRTFGDMARPADGD
eukprot:1481257-Prymnesium_polylepis.1